MNRRPALILATSVAALLSGPSARAVDYTLNVSNTIATSNSWDTTTIWTPNGVPNGTTDAFKFAEGNPGTTPSPATTLNLDVGSRTVGGILLTGGDNDQLVIAGPNSLILDAGGAGTLATVNSGNGSASKTKLAISAPISINSNVQFVDNATPQSATTVSSMNITGAITGTGNITIGVKTGVNASFGGINNVGTLTIGNTAAATVAGVATAALTNAGTTQITGVIGTSVTGVTVNNGTTILSGANTYASGTTVNGGLLATTTTGTFGTGSVTITGTGSLTLGNTASIASTGLLLFSATTTAINLNFSGTDTVAGITNTTSGISEGPGLYTAAQLNTFFGVTSFTGAGLLQVVPEPSTWVMLAGGLGALMSARRIRHRNA